MKPILRIAAILFFFCSISTSSFAQADNCGATAPVLTVNPTCVLSTTVYNTTTATASSQSSAYVGNDDDVWFSFTTLANQNGAKIELGNTAGAGMSPIAIELWGSCTDGSMIASNNSGLLVGNLSPSTQYYVRVYTTGTSTRLSAFQICVYNVLGNDECTYSKPLTLNNGTNCTNTVNGTTDGATNGFAAITGCFGEPYYSIKDVWYKFVATANNATISLTNIALVSGTSSSLSMQMINDCSSSTSLQCGTSGTLSATGLVIGTTYYVRVYNQDAASTSTFTICANVSPSPINNECIAAAVVAVNTDGTFNLAINATTVNATQSTNSMLPCTIPADDDVWFKFVAPSTGAIQLNISNNSQTMFTSVYGGACGSLASRKCIYGTTDTLLSLVPNAIYYLRVMTQNSNVNSIFTLALRSIAAPVTNTTCATAAALTTVYQQGTTAGLTVNSSIIACYGSAAPNKELWYSFTATATNHFIEITDMIRLSSNANNLGFRLYSGTCAALTQVSPCVTTVTANNTVFTGLTIGATYYVQVMENTYNGGPVQFAIRLKTVQTPGNDEYNGAAVPTLVQEPTASYASTTARFSTLSLGAPSGTYTQDVWYRFYAASSSATVSIIDGFTQAPRLMVYESNGTTIKEAGSQNYSIPVTALTVGNLYYIRVLNTGPSATDNGTEDFKIAVFGIPSSSVADAAPVGSNCVTADGPVTSTNSGRWLHITHQGKMLASIFDNAGNSMGAMTAKYFTNSAGVRSDATGIEYLDRNYEITPAVQPTNPVMVRLYFSKAEFDAMINANDGDGNDVLWLSDLKIAKFSSVPCASTLTLTGEQLYNIYNWGALNTTVYYIDVQVPAFSSFFLKTVAGGLLPATCSNFNYKLADGKVKLLWSTQTETNTKDFELQKSSDGINFSTIATIIAAGSSSNQKDYQFTDMLRNNETIYYRLQQTDKDGKKQFICRTIKVNTTGKNSLFSNAYPNPVTSSMTIDILKPFAGKADIQVLNVMGQVMQQQSFNLQASDAQLKINMKNLQPGAYSIRLITNEGVQVQQVTKM
jgi:hypothetical protein